MFLGLHKELIKPQTRGLLCSRRPPAPAWIVEGTPPWAPSRVGLRSPGRKVNAESLCVPSDQPEKEREGERERESTWGRPSLCKKPINLFSKGAYNMDSQMICNVILCDWRVCHIIPFMWFLSCMSCLMGSSGWTWPRNGHIHFTCIFSLQYEFSEL